MKALHSIALFLTILATPTAICAEKNVKLNFPQANVEMIASFYPHLCGKTVILDNPELGLIPIIVDAGETCLTNSQALRFIESALYLKGIEIVPKGEKEVVFTRFAVINTTPERRRIIKAN